ncbi:MAG TPA: hypothetical protein VFT43_01265, partial [Candidatus Polarisedimenticolia bacterium]|nr:hypothetical protein [Candidatus Polarisedimenticolia bacterium]
MTPGGGTPGRVASKPIWKSILPPLLAGLAARLLLIAWTTPLTLSHDETRLWDLATTRMRGTAFVPPLYPFFLAALRALLGDDVTRA